MSFSKKVREKIFSKYNGHYAYCGNKLGEIKDMQVDHIIAKRRHIDHHLLENGLNDDSNLNPSCRSCNKFKDTFSIEQFREEVSKQIERLRRDRPTFRLAERFGLIECKEEKPVIFYFEKFNNPSV